MDFANIQYGLMLYLILLGSLCVHEWAHAFMADRLGDDTPYMKGRLTLNPLAHIDPLGTVVIPLAMILLSPGFAIIGWAKPVPFNPRNLKHPVRDDILISLAGPCSNLLICVVMALLGGVVLRFFPQAGNLFGLVLWINALLMMFNLLPVPPLDGSHVFRHLVRMSTEAYMKFAQWGFLVLIVMINIPLFQYILFSAIFYIFGLMATIGGFIGGFDPVLFFPFD